MGEIKAGIVLMNEFCTGNSKLFGGYINYMNRENAVRNEHMEEYNIYHDYMGNPEKSTGLFSNRPGKLDQKEKERMKKLFKEAQDNGSLMWQTVISFDNRWLEKNGLYDSETGILDEVRLQEYATTGMKKMLHNENLDHAVWTASFHYNTDNIHIHAAAVEVIPMREKKLYRQYSYGRNEKNRIVRNGDIVDLNGNPVYQEEMKGKFKLKSFEMCKSHIVNQILREKDLNKELNEIIRKQFTNTLRSREIAGDTVLSKQIQDLRSDMPECSKNLWHYNNSIMAPYREKIDGISRAFLERTYPEEFKDFQRKLRYQSNLYEEAYGKSTIKESFADAKMRDLYTRMGNSILTMVRTMPEKVTKENTNLERISEAEKEINVPEEPVLDIPETMVEDEKKLKEDLSVDKEHPEKKGYEKYLQGRGYYYGQGMEADLQKAVEYLETSIELGNENAYYLLGKIYLNPEEGYYDPDKGTNYLEKAAEKGDAYAAYKLGSFYADQDKEKSVKYYRQAKDNFHKMDQEGKNSDAKYWIGMMYYYGQGTEKDFQKAAQYFEAAEKMGNEKTYYMLGKIYSDTTYVNFDLKKGISYFEKAAEKGNAYAASRIGDIYYYQMHDRSTAVKWYSQASKAGDTYGKTQILKVAAGVGHINKNYEMDKALMALKRSLKKDWETVKNTMEYDRELEKRIKQEKKQEIDIG